MCVSCGCHEPTNTHGDGRNIILDDILAAGDAAGLTLPEVARNIQQTTDILLSSDVQAAFESAANRPAIISDVDCTLACYQEAVIAMVNAITGKSYRMVQWTSYDGPFTADERAWVKECRETDPSFFANLAPDTEAILALNAIHKAGFPVTVCSNRPPQWAEVSSQWLTDHGVSRDSDLFMGPKGKPTLLAAHGPDLPAVLLDDNPAFWMSLARPGVTIYAPRRGYTPISSMYPHVRVFDSWSEPLFWLGITDSARSFC